jgi:molybdopterin-guanine dinucleotide biosynthesis protein A
MIYGLVLAGGRSSRMGKDKSLLTFHDKPQREHVFELLTGFCDKVFVSCNNEQQIPPHLNPLPDQFDVGTPLSGILTALKHEPLAAWLVVAVDMPMVNKHVLQHLINNRKPETKVTCYWDSDHQYPEPLLGLWEPGVYQDVLEFINNGKNSSRGFLMQTNITLLEPVASTLHLNINTPEELQQFKKDSTDHKE